MQQAPSHTPVVRYQYRRDPVAVVLDALGGHPPIKPDGSFLVRCPSHDDGTPSLSVRAGDDGRALLHCHAGCPTETVVAALGLRMADLFPPDAPGGARGGGSSRGGSPPAAPTPSPRPHPAGGLGGAGEHSARREKPFSAADIVAEYVYHEEEGTVAGRVIRLTPKSFRQQRPNGRGGWSFGLDGRKLPLYQLPRLIDTPMDQFVLIVEGEKDADALNGIGLTATTCPGGAGRWDSDYRRHLVNRYVAILPDNDPPGWNHAANIARDLFGVAADVRVVALPNLPPKGDVSDWLAAGGFGAKLADLVHEANRVAFTGEWDEPLSNLFPYAVKSPPAKPTLRPTDDDPDGSGGPGGPPPGLHGPTGAELDLPFRTARDLGERAAADTVWVAKPWVAAGAITELDGRAKASGKTTLATHLVRAILDGRPFLGEPTARMPVVYLTEQSPPAFREALRWADLLTREDLSVLAWHDVAAATWPDVVAAAVIRAKAVGAGLLVVDTLPQFAGLRGDAENNAGAALEAIAPLQVAAGGAGLAVLMLRHERKGGGEVGESGRGSSAFAGAVDVILQLRRPEGNTRPTLRVLSSLSRFDETPGELVIELTDAGYVSHGDVAAVAKMEADEAILRVAPTSEDGAVSFDELLELSGDIGRTTAKLAVAAFAASGQLLRSGTGRRGNAYRYWRPAPFVTPTDSVVPKVRVLTESIARHQVPGHRADEATRAPAMSLATAGPLDSVTTSVLSATDSIREIVLPSNVIFIEDRRPPWEEEDPAATEATEATGADLPLVADLAAGCIEPNTCAELGDCGKDGAPVCGPASPSFETGARDAAVGAAPRGRPWPPTDPVDAAGTAVGAVPCGRPWSPTAWPETARWHDPGPLAPIGMATEPGRPGVATPTIGPSSSTVDADHGAPVCGPIGLPSEGASEQWTLPVVPRVVRGVA